VPTCPNCGEENPERARFCLACGTPLTAALEAAEERKVVSVLFVDLVGFTADSDRADPEDVRARLQPYHARVKREIERFGGTVEKFVGDAVMAVFGAPVAREDDAERAVRAGLRVLDAVAELGLEARAAVNTGEALVALGARAEAGEALVAGDVVNTAARLQQGAATGMLVVGETTYRATRQAIVYDTLEPLVVKGKAAPVAAWGAKEARSRFGIDLDPEAVTPLVGREPELALLKEVFARSVRESSVQLVTITGEPGIGKSRLVSEFRAYLDEQSDLVYWRQGRCLPYGEGITFWALGEIVKAHAGILDSDGPDEAADKLVTAVEAAADEASERDWIRNRLAPLVGARSAEAGGTERAESFAAWQRFLEGLASVRPLVAVIEDLHWADPALLDFVEHLLGWSSAVPLLVLCTARPELYERHPGWGGGTRNSTTIGLDPLTGEETTRLFAGLLSQTALPAETHGVLLEKAGGNPLYAEEFVRMLGDRGLLLRRGRVVELAKDGEIPVPDTVQALIAARLDTLPPSRKALVHDAAVVGKVFWAGAIAAIGAIDESAAKEGLRDLVRKELVRPARRSSVEGQEEFAFWHLLVRDVAYGQIPRAARASKHRAAAEWIERVAGDRVADRAEILVHHYGQSLELARAGGASDGLDELAERYRRFLHMAGQHAFHLDVRKADAWYQEALSLFPRGDPDRPNVLVHAASGAQERGRLREAAQGYEEAIAAFRAQGAPLLAGRTMVELSRALWQLGQGARSNAVLAEAVELLEREPPGPELARAYVRVTGMHMLSARARECLEWAEKTLPLVQEFGLDNLAVRVLQNRGVARCELGDFGGLDDLREALRASLELGLSVETGTSYANLGCNIWPVDGPERALKIHREGIQFSERRGTIHNAMWLRGESLWMLFDLGHWDELLRTAGELLDWEQEHGRSQISVIAWSYRARVLVLRGATDDAAELLQEFLPRAREIEDPQVLAPALTIAAMIEQASGDSPAAVTLLEELELVTAGTPDFRSLNLTEALRLCAAADALTLAERLVGGASETAAEFQHAVLTGRAILAEANGRPAEAASLFATAAERWAEWGHALERAEALLGAGRCILALGRRAEARPSLEAAREAFAGLGARPSVAVADGLLAEATALSS
jgi:class 3 adenylate cyclase/tetratricopeptide (TPR) repeat protein